MTPFFVNDELQDFVIFTDPSRLPITQNNAIQIFGTLPDDISAKNTVVFIDITFPDGKVTNLKTLTNQKGQFYIPYIIEKENRDLSPGTYNIAATIDNDQGEFFAYSGFLVFDPEMIIQKD